MSKELEEKVRQFLRQKGLTDWEGYFPNTVESVTELLQQHTAEVERKLAVAVEALGRIDYYLKDVTGSRECHNQILGAKAEAEMALSKIAGD